MASSGPNTTGTAADGGLNGGSGTAWTNPTNAQVDDGVFATSTSNVAPTHWLDATNFGFAIPAGATINGILVEIKGKASLSSNVWNNVRIKKGGARGSTELASGAVPTTNQYTSFGGASNLWGETWAATDINSSTFGVSFSPFRSGGESAITFSMDSVRITITYTAAAASTPSVVSDTVLFT